MRLRLHGILAMFRALARIIAQRHSPLSPTLAGCCQRCSGQTDRLMNRWTATTERSDNGRLKFINPLQINVIDCDLACFHHSWHAHGYRYGHLHDHSICECLCISVFSSDKSLFNDMVFGCCLFWSVMLMQETTMLETVNNLATVQK